MLTVAPLSEEPIILGSLLLDEADCGKHFAEATCRSLIAFGISESISPDLRNNG
jgi:hypothetical protein